MKVGSRPTLRACILVLACSLLGAARVPVYANPHAPTDPAGASYSVYVMSRLMAACAYDREVRMARGPVSDAQALVIDDQETVMYNPAFLDALDSRTGNPWWTSRVSTTCSLSRAG